MRHRSWHRAFGGTGPHTFPCGGEASESIGSLPALHGRRSSMEEHPAVVGMVGGSIPLGDPGMSYRKKKLKRSKLNRLKFQSRMAWNKFLGNVRWLLNKQGGYAMRFPATVKVMAFLRDRNRLIRPNNLKVNDWVDSYLDRCVANGDAVTVLTQWCISKDLEQRCREQGGAFVPTRKERRIFETEIPKIAGAFLANGFRLNWWITFNRSYLDSGQISSELENSYKAMVAGLARPLIERGWLILADWEDDTLQKRPQPNSEVLNAPERYVQPQALELEIKRHSSWAREEAGLKQNDEELRRDVYLQIACEAEEGRLFDGNDSPLGEFILIPLEVPERYDFFLLLAPQFKRRIVAVLPPYPWRLKDSS